MINYFFSTSTASLNFLDGIHPSVALALHFTDKSRSHQVRILHVFMTFCGITGVQLFKTNFVS